MDLEELQAAAAPGHVCDATCVAASEVECDCSAAPTMCGECRGFYTDHPGAM